VEKKSKVSAFLVYRINSLRDLMTQNKTYLIGCLSLIAIAFSITILAVAFVAKPIGADTYFHLHISQLISQGNIIEAWNYPIQENFFPYGLLLFHFLEAPLYYTGNVFLSARILEALFMPLTFLFTMFLMVKHVNAKAAFFTGLCLLGSLAFVDGALQLRPESLDLLLYPLMLFAVLSIKKKSFIISALAAIYGHGLAALSNIYGVALYLLKEKQWRKTITAGLIGTLPILALSLYYIQGAFHKWFTLAGTNNSNPQQTLFWTQPLIWIPFYSGLTLFGFVFMFKRNKNYFESILTCGILASAIMIPFWADRWLQYIAIPLSCLVGLGLREASTKKLLIILPILVTVSLLYISYWWFIGLSHQFWQPGN
jgi:hypothetical protein